MDRDMRKRIERAVRRGEAASNPQEARIAVELARSHLRLLPWVVGLMIASIVLGIVVIAFHVLAQRTDVVAWRSVGVAFAVVALALSIRWRKKAREAEARNTALLDAGDPGR